MCGGLAAAFAREPGHKNKYWRADAQWVSSLRWVQGGSYLLRNEKPTTNHEKLPWSNIPRMDHSPRDLPQCWPALPLSSWNDTRATLHMWTQIVGKVRLALTPKVNHWWNVPLYVTSRGLTTSQMPYAGRAFELCFDFFDHQLVLQSSDGTRKALPLAPRSVADFYQQFMDMLRSARLDVKIWKMPVEIPDPIPFDRDQVHASYDRSE